VSKTSTPELTPVVLRHLEDSAAAFGEAHDFDGPTRWAPVCRAGLIQKGERTSTEPLSHRVIPPPELNVDNLEPALQPFVNQSPWYEQPVLKRYRAFTAEAIADPEGISELPRSAVAWANTKARNTPSFASPFPPSAPASPR
jgi:hypothetical protein